MRGLTLLALFGVCLGQKPARIGPDGKPLLNRPDLAECMKSKYWMLNCSRQIVISVCVSGKSHMKVGNHNYFLSWREPWHKFEVRWRRPDLGLNTPHHQTWPTSRMLITHQSHLTTYLKLIFRTGTGSMDATSAEIVVWISCLSTLLESMRCFPRS